MIRLSDLAQETGLNIATVSRALRDDARVKPETKAVVREAAQRLGYRPHWGARALAEGRSRTVWLLTPGLDSPIEREPAAWAGRWLLDRGYDLLIAQHYNDPAIYGRLLERLSHGGADGALVIPGQDRHPDSQADRLTLSQGIPLVYLDRRVEEVPASFVGTDNRAAVETAVRRLAASGGGTPVAWVYDHFQPERNLVEADRSQGLRTAAAERGLTVFDRDHLPRAAELVRPGLLLASRYAELAAVAAAWGPEFRSRQRLVHRAVVFDEGGEGAFFEVVVVRQDFRALGEEAARILLESLGAGGHPPQELLVPALRFEGPGFRDGSTF